MVALLSLGGYAVQAQMNQVGQPIENRHQVYHDTKTRTAILPLGEALVFAGIGTVTVVWMRKRRLL